MPINTTDRRELRRNKDERIKIATARVRHQAGTGRINLRKLELELMEELSVDSLESKEAKQFLAKIPDAKTLLPSPSKKEIKALVAGS